MSDYTYSPQTSSTSFPEEVDILLSIFKNGLECFEYFLTDTDSSSNQAGQNVNNNNAFTFVKEDKETMEVFASIFTYIEPYMFQEVMADNITFLFEQTLKTPNIASISQYFFSSPTVTAGFSGLMLRFLVDNLDQLGGADQVKSALLFKFFKLVFMAVTLFPDQNEMVLKPHLANIIMSSLKLSAKSSDSLNFFLLLRALFRNIGGGRFEALYQEVLPLLQVLLENLNSLVASSHTTQMRELFVELCLTVSNAY